jgi:fibronectin type 3 domain-containing protein
MKRSTRIISTSLAAMMAVSTLAVGTASVSAAAKVKKPTGVKAVNKAKGIKITWKKVKGAKKYQLFRGKKKITTTKKKAYTDKKAKAGNTYKYTVKAVKGKKVSKKSKAVKVVRLTKPVIKSAVNAVSGVKVTWKKVKGAKNYFVYRGTKKVASVKGTSATDTGVASGKTYTYKVKAVNGKSTSVKSAKASVSYLAAPAVKVNVTKEGAAVLNWDDVNGAVKYEVYAARTDAVQKYVKAGDSTLSTYTFYLGENPTAYAFKVYAVNGTKKSAANEVGSFYIPDGCYFTDADGNLHVKIALKKGEQYVEGAYGVQFLKNIENSDYAISVDDESAKYISVKDGVITAEAEGKGTVTVKITTPELQQFIYDKTCDILGKTFGNKLTTGKIFVDVTVTE